MAMSEKQRAAKREANRLAWNNNPKNANNKRIVALKEKPVLIRKKIDPVEKETPVETPKKIPKEIESVELPQTIDATIDSKIPLMHDKDTIKAYARDKSYILKDLQIEAINALRAKDLSTAPIKEIVGILKITSDMDMEMGSKDDLANKILNVIDKVSNNRIRPRKQEEVKETILQAEVVK